MAGRMKRRLAFPPTCKAPLELSCLEKAEGSRKAGSQNKHKTKIDIKMSREKDQNIYIYFSLSGTFEFANRKSHLPYLFPPDSDMAFFRGQ